MRNDCMTFRASSYNGIAIWTMNLCKNNFKSINLKQIVLSDA